MRNAGLEEAQAGIKTAGRNINNLRYADDTTLMAESAQTLPGTRVPGGSIQGHLYRAHLSHTRLASSPPKRPDCNCGKF